MTYQIIIPVRPPEEGKSRLAQVLDPVARAALVERMFRHVLGVAVRAVPAPQVRVVSRSRWLLDIAAAGGAQAVREEGCGLNRALEQAAALCDPALPLLALSADLPLLGEADLAAMAAGLRDADVVAAADRDAIGTNALLLRRPGLIDYRFGDRSLAAHCAEAKQAGLLSLVVTRTGLSCDVDYPEDLSFFNNIRLQIDAH